MHVVIWDQRLVPDVAEEALDYDKVLNEARAARPKAALEPTAPIFYSRASMNKPLGRIANLHLACCDIQEGGALDPLCLDLAQAQSLAVRFCLIDFITNCVRPSEDLHGHRSRLIRFFIMLFLCHSKII